MTRGVGARPAVAAAAVTRWWATTLFALALLGTASSALADTFWDRTLAAARGADTSLLHAVERALLGLANDRDLLTVRRGFVDMARGIDFGDARIDVALVTLRREAGLAPSSSTPARLSASLTASGLPAYYRAQAHLELGLFRLAEGDNRAAEVHGRGAIASAWQSEQQAEGWLLVGRVGVHERRFLDAADAFARAAELAPGRRLLAAALALGGWAQGQAGDRASSESLRQRARAVANHRASASGLGVFDGLNLEPDLLAAVEAFLE